MHKKQDEKTNNKNQHRKLNIAQHEPRQNMQVTSNALEVN